MHLHSFHHSLSEGLGEIAAWAQRKGHILSATHLDQGDPIPTLKDIDWLIVMGGPMNIYEHRNYPWLVAEKVAIAQAIAQGKRVLGICLGAQLIADALGGKVFQNPEVEIGWFPIRLQAEAAQHPAFAEFPDILTPLHWHGDTFSLPPEAVSLASSEACRHQAFANGPRIIGLQFHLEVGLNDVTAFVDAEGTLGEGRFIQQKTVILREAPAHLPADHTAMEKLLDAMEQA